MITKNISVKMEPGKKVPIEETYLVFPKKNEVKLVKKFEDPSRNAEIVLTKKECERMMNLLAFYLLENSYTYEKDKMLVIEE